MTLGDLAEEAQDMSEEEKSGSSESSSSSSSSYPKTEERVPYVAIWKEDGEFKSGYRPQNQFVVYRKKRPNSSWELKLIPEEMERYWMDKNSFRRIEFIVEEELDMDLRELIHNRPEQALTAIRRAAQRRGRTDDKRPMTVECAVCGEDIHVVKSDYVEVDNRRVCNHHSVQELQDKELI